MNQRLPTMPIMHSPPGAQTVIDHRRYVYFAGTGYLGLQGHAEVIRAACEATRQYGLASANSRTAFGTMPPTLDVERRAAEMFGLDDAFYFMSGYVGNNILLLLLRDQIDAVFIDEFSHYCVFEAAQLSGHTVIPFQHAAAEDLAAKLKTHLAPAGRPLVLTDGVFAARGEIAPVAEYRSVLQSYAGSILSLDDAHGLGVLGDRGRGTFEYAGLFEDGVNRDIAVGDAGVNREIAVGDASYNGGDAARSTPLPCPAPRLFFCGTLSKAIGGFGGIIPGTAEFIERLKTTSPYFGGASAPPVPAAAATARALELVSSDPDMRRRLWRNAGQLKSGLRAMGFPVDDTPVPIACLTVGEAGNMQRIQQELMGRGIAVAYMAAYSGLGPQGALRIAVFATHTEEMIERLLDALRELV